MRLFVSIAFLMAAALVAAWAVFFDALALPLGALMVGALLYFSWRQALLYSLGLSLFWESTTPLPLGQVSLPLICGVLLLQLLFRHQLRANLLSRAFAAVLLQSIVFFAAGALWPPAGFLNALLQLLQTLGGFCWAILLGAAWLWALTLLAQHRFNLNLEHRLKDL